MDLIWHRPHVKDSVHELGLAVVLNDALRIPT